LAEERREGKKGIVNAREKRRKKKDCRRGGGKGGFTSFEGERMVVHVDEVKKGPIPKRTKKLRRKRDLRWQKRGRGKKERVGRGNSDTLLLPGGGFAEQKKESAVSVVELRGKKEKP